MVKFYIKISIIQLFILFNGCSSEDKFVINFRRINTFDSLAFIRNEYNNQITEKNYNIETTNKYRKEIDSLYWSRMIEVLDSSITHTIDLDLSAAQKITKILAIKESYNQYKYSGILSKENEESIKIIFDKLESGLVRLRHLQAWDNRRNNLLNTVKQFGRDKFKPFSGYADVEAEIIDIIDSVKLTNEGDVKKYEYTVSYMKIYNGFYKWKALGTGNWLVSCRNDQTYIEVVNLCPECYQEKRIE